MRIEVKSLLKECLNVSQESDEVKVEVTVPVADPDAEDQAQVEADFVEVEADAAEVDTVDEALETMIDAVEAVTDIQKEAEDSIPEGGMEAPAVKVAEIALEHFLRKLPALKGGTPSLESFNSESGRLESTVSFEAALGDKAKALVRGILNAVKAAVAKIGKWLVTLVSSTKALKKRLEGLETSLKGVTGEANYTDDKFTVPAAKALSNPEGSVKMGDIKAHLQKLTGLANDAENQLKGAAGYYKAVADWARAGGAANKDATAALASSEGQPLDGMWASKAEPKDGGVLTGSDLPKAADVAIVVKTAVGVVDAYEKKAGALKAANEARDEAVKALEQAASGAKLDDKDAVKAARQAGKEVGKEARRLFTEAFFAARGATQLGAKVLAAYKGKKEEQAAA